MKRCGLILCLTLCAPWLSASEHPAAVKDEVTADRVLQDLKDGNERFVREGLRGQAGKARRLELVKGQHPEAIVLSCSDSRVPPEYIFDRGLGHLFVIRVAGPVVDPAVLASIDYAVRHLGPKLLVVLGHERCGAVTAAVSALPGRAKETGELLTLVTAIQKNLKGGTYLAPEKDPGQRTAAQANVQAVARQVLERSAAVRSAVERGRLRIEGALYSLESGQVEFLHAEEAK